MASNDLNAADYVVVGGSLVAMFGVAAASSWRTRNSKAASTYFLAGRSMPWWICAASLFASNVGTEHFVGQAGSAATRGIAVAMYEWTAGYLLIALGWVFAPVYLRCGLSTIPEFLEQRFNASTRALLVGITLVTYAMTKLGASLYAGAVIMRVLTGMSMWVSAPIVILLTCAYTAAGGLTAVMLTDLVQLFIFVVGGLVGTGISLSLVGGQAGLFSGLDGFDLGYFKHLVRSADDAEYPWPGMFFGVPVAALWYWCIDQEMAQRVLSVEDVPAAKLGCGAAGFMKILPPFITVFPGMVARLLFEQCNASGGTTFPRWCNSAMDQSQGANEAYPLLVLYEFPHFVKGIMVAAFLAAMMSSLAAIYNSAATIFSYDVYQRFKYPGTTAPASEMLWVGRATTIVMTGLSLAFLPIIDAQQDEGLYMVVQSASMHLAPAIAVTFLMGILWKRANGYGAMAGLAGGSVFGMIRFIVSLIAESSCVDQRTGPDDTLMVYTVGNWFGCLTFTYFSLLLGGLIALTIVIVSLATPPPPPEATEGKLVQWFAQATGQERSPAPGKVSTVDNPAFEVQMSEIQMPRLPADDSSLPTGTTFKRSGSPKDLLPANQLRSDEPTSPGDGKNKPAKGRIARNQEGHLKSVESEEDLRKGWGHIPDGGQWVHEHRELIANFLAVGLAISLAIVLAVYW